MPVRRDESSVSTRWFGLFAVPLVLTAACVQERQYAEDTATYASSTSSSTSGASTNTRDSGLTGSIETSGEADAATSDGAATTLDVTGQTSSTGPNTSNTRDASSDTSDDGDRDTTSDANSDDGGTRPDAGPVLQTVSVSLDVDELSSMDDRATLTVWCQYEGEELENCTNRASIDITNPSAVSLDDKQLAPLKNGETAIIASVEGVTSEPATLIVDVGLVCATLNITGTATAPNGTSVQWSATCDYDDGRTNVPVINDVTWESSAPTIASISDTGRVNASAVGGAQITASVANPDRTTASATRSFTVTNGQLVGITVSAVKAVSVPKGRTTGFTAECEYTDVTSPCTTDVTWVSSAPGIASINQNGVLSGTDTGTTNVSAKLGTLTSNALAVTVTAPVLDNIVLSPNGAVTVEVNTTRALTATCVMSDLSSSVCTAQVTWNSSQPLVAAPNATGSLAGLDTGTSLITATLSGVTSPAVTATVVPPKGCESALTFRDIIMELNVRRLLDKPAGSIYYEDVKSIKRFENVHGLSAGEDGPFYMTDLDGIQCFTALEALAVTQAQIKSLAPIEGLIHLTEVNVRMTHLERVPDLTLLTKLEYLDVSSTNITDVMEVVLAEHFADGDTLNLSGSVNCSDDWILGQIADLEKRGVDVLHNCREL